MWRRKDMLGGSLIIHAIDCQVYFLVDHSHHFSRGRDDQVHM